MKYARQLELTSLQAVKRSMLRDSSGRMRFNSRSSTKDIGFYLVSLSCCRTGKTPHTNSACGTHEFSQLR